jgi:glycerol-3-phosphate cytidylyltransferase-like family protein
LGDYLIVGVSTDKLIESYKNCKPVIPYRDRVLAVKCCKFVDKVIPQTKIMDKEVLKKYKVNCVTLGDDWKGVYLEGLAWMKSRGDVIYLPYTKGISTTQIKTKIIKNSYKIIESQLLREFKRNEIKK